MTQSVAATALATASSILMGLLYAAPAQASPISAVPDEGDIIRIGLGQKARLDRCLTGMSLHLGGPAVKGIAARGLAGSDAELAALVERWPVAVQEAEDQDQGDKSLGEDPNSRKARLEAANKIYAQTGWSSGTQYHAPEFDEAARAFARKAYENHYSRVGIDDGRSTAGKAAVAKAREVADSVKGANWMLDLMATDLLRSAAGGGLHPPGTTATDIATFLRYGGFPSAPVEEDSAEYRLEVERLKAAWGACDSFNPIDPNRVLSPLVVTAHAEWEAEYAAQAKPRAEIVDAEITASTQARKANEAMLQSLGQAWLADQILLWQKYWAGQPKSNIHRPEPEVFTKANADLAKARDRAAAQLTIANAAVTTAKTASDKASAAQQSAYTIADTAKTPRGRGLLYAQQSAQVTKASYAATLAAAKATQTAVNAAKATVANSGALFALSQTQTHALNTEFRKAAALEAAAQAKSAAAAAEAQAKEAAANATKAKNAQATAEAAEETARVAAATAKTERGKAEKEKATAAAEAAIAASERAKAQEAEARAQSERTAAGNARSAAEAAGSTSWSKLAEAEAAEKRAYEARDAAEEAERKKNATASRSRSLEAAAAAAEGSTAAKETREAATEARAAANDASGAATRARAAANDASSAAVNARAAATRADAASERARSAADSAWSAYMTSYSAAQTAHAAAAEAIDASAAAKTNAKTAEAEAKKAQAAAAKAREESIAANAEAAKTSAWAARTAGYSFAAGEAASGARDAATQAVSAANDAINIGTPYQESDSSAAFAVLVGQTAKSMAEQQADAAEAKAKSSAKMAAEAKALADKANGDAKIAAQAAAAAAADAAKALQSAAAARASAAEASKAADAAKKADAKTTEYNAQASEDAFYAESAARDAESSAGTADRDATEAEKDASSARSAASAAETDASSARNTATKAESNANAAETAAKNADTAAKDADQAASRAEEEERKELEADRKAAMEAGDTGVLDGNPGAELSADDEAILRAECGQTCVDDYRSARAAVAASVVDWIRANGAEVLLEVLGVNNVKRCFSQGDIESCLWALVDAASLVVIIGKAPAIAKAILTVTSGISKFFQKAEWGERTLKALRKIIQKVRKEGHKPPECLVKGKSGAKSAAFALASSSMTGNVRAAQADTPEVPCLKAITAGPNMKAHYLKHRALLQKVLNKTYPKWKDDEGAEFLADLFELVKSGRFKFKGMGTLPHPDADGTYPAKLIFRGEGLTMVLKPGGEWQTLLTSGTGMDLRIRML